MPQADYDDSVMNPVTYDFSINAGTSDCQRDKKERSMMS